MSELDLTLAQQWRDYRASACDGESPELSRAEKADLVRYTLALLERDHPGHSVEVRVVPFGAVQILEGAHHRRGTPPAVVETKADTWLALAAGALDWDDAADAALVDASGERSNLAHYLPL